MPLRSDSGLGVWEAVSEPFNPGLVVWEAVSEPPTPGWGLGHTNSRAGVVGAGGAAVGAACTVLCARPLFETTNVYTVRIQSVLMEPAAMRSPTNEHPGADNGAAGTDNGAAGTDEIAPCERRQAAERCLG